MSKTYAIADLHGRYDLLMDALYAIRDFDAGKPGGTIVTLGDYVDRGPQSRRIIETLMAGLDPIFGEDHGFKLVCLKGNHEDMMVGCINGQDIEWWLTNGGNATMKSYGGSVPKAHLAWCAALPMIHTDVHRVFVHAGVEPSRPLNAQGEAVLLWMRYPENADIEYPGKHIVHGHTPNRAGPEVYAGRTNLDTLAWRTGRAVIAVFDDETPGGPISFLEIKGQPFSELEQAA